MMPDDPQPGRDGGAPDEADLHGLLSAWIDGRLDAADSARLDAALRTSPAARDAFREWVALDSMLATLSATDPAADGGSPGTDVRPAAPPTPTGSSHSRVWSGLVERLRRAGGWSVPVAALAGAVAVMAAVWLRRPADPRPADVAGGCAVVGRMIDKYPLKPVYLWIVAAQALCLALATQLSGWAFYAIQFVFMATIFGAVPFTDAMLVRFVDDTIRSRVAGMRLAVSIGASSLAIFLIGPLVKQAGFTALLWVMAVTSVATFAVILNLPSMKRS